MDSQPPSRYAKSSRPVNLRTAARLQQPVADEALVHPKVEQRIAAQRAKNRLGAPLADLLAQQLNRLQPAQGGRLQQPPGLLVIGGVMLAAAAGVAMLLGGIQQSWMVAAAGAIGLLGGIGLVLAGRQRARLADGALATAGSTTAPLWSQASIAAFDQAVDALAAVLPVEAASHLSAIKLQLARIHQQINSRATTADEFFTMDDRLYLGELVRRYLPDTLQSYLAVPEAQRDAAIAGQTVPATATSLLLNQLLLLRCEMDKKEAKLAQSRAESLLRQQRFLESKASR